MMTDRYDAFIVILEKDIRDDAQDTINAIRQIKGVLDVQPHTPDSSNLIARMRIRTEIEQKLFSVLRDIQ
jgi:hypothetical protein